MTKIAFISNIAHRAPHLDPMLRALEAHPNLEYIVAVGDAAKAVNAYLELREQRYLEEVPYTDPRYYRFVYESIRGNQVEGNQQELKISKHLRHLTRNLQLSRVGWKVEDYTITEEATPPAGSGRCLVLVSQPQQPKVSQPSSSSVLLCPGVVEGGAAENSMCAIVEFGPTLSITFMNADG